MPQFNDIQKSILKEFLALNHVYGEDTYLPYRCFNSGTKKELQPEFKKLRELGYIKFKKGLFSDSGQVAGAGHGLASDKVGEIRNMFMDSPVAAVPAYDGPILRASFTVMKLWSNGDIQGAIDVYLKRERVPNKAMIDGINLHKKWQEEVQKTQSLPAVFGSRKLISQYTEQRFESQVTPWMSLRGIIDCYDKVAEDSKYVIIRDWKSGSGSASDYAGSMQAEIYAWLLAANGIYSDRAFYHCWNQHLGEAESALVWITDERLTAAVEWMVTFGSEMHNYFIENGIYEMESTMKEVIY